jgi:hypothetical protein
MLTVVPLHRLEACFFPVSAAASKLVLTDPREDIKRTHRVGSTSTEAVWRRRFVRVKSFHGVSCTGSIRVSDFHGAPWNRLFVRVRSVHGNPWKRLFVRERSCHGVSCKKSIRVKSFHGLSSKRSILLYQRLRG